MKAQPLVHPRLQRVAMGQQHEAAEKKVGSQHETHPTTLRFPISLTIGVPSPTYVALRRVHCFAVQMLADTAKFLSWPSHDAAVAQPGRAQRRTVTLSVQYPIGGTGKREQEQPTDQQEMGATGVME